MAFTCVFAALAAMVYAQAPRPGTAAPSPGISAPKPAAPTAKVAGRVTAADTGKPLRRATVQLMAQPSKIIRIAQTDRDGRYEFQNVAAGRYGVMPAKDGYVFISENPFAGGRGVEVTDGEVLDRHDFVLSRGSVITGRITDEYGEPMANVVVQAARYQFRPSGARQLIMGSSGNYYMPASTNDRGEYRIFGLRPGPYYLSARAMDMPGAISLAQSGGSGIGAVDSNDGLATTFYPGTANIAEAQTVPVGLMHQASASFTLVPARMARVSGTVIDSQGRPFVRARVDLRSTSGVVGGWLGTNVRALLSPEGTFALTNIAPGDYTLEVRPNTSGGAAGQQGPLNEYASVPVTVGGDDLNLAISTTPGIAVSGRVVFEGGSNIALENLRISAAPEEDGRNFLSYQGPDSGQVASDGQFHIPGVYGKVIFRTSPLPVTVMLKSVRLNGVDITDTPFDATRSEDVTNLEVRLIDQQGRISGYARNERGEIQYNYRLVTYPANPKPGDVTIRYQHNTSPNVNGQFNIGRMPPGDYIGLAVKGVQPGEEWDPELRKRIEQFGKRFSLKEGETLQLEMPYVE
jgi:protocatechuate 3,4-dioxygenase beta subunit